MACLTEERYKDIVEYLRGSRIGSPVYPSKFNANNKRALCQQAATFEKKDCVLYHLSKTSRGKTLRCMIVDPAEKTRLIRACHDGVNGGHFECCWHYWRHYGKVHLQFLRTSFSYKVFPNVCSSPKWFQQDSSSRQCIFSTVICGIFHIASYGSSFSTFAFLSRYLIRSIFKLLCLQVQSCTQCQHPEAHFEELMMDAFQCSNIGQLYGWGRKNSMWVQNFCKVLFDVWPILHTGPSSLVILMWWFNVDKVDRTVPFFKSTLCLGHWWCSSIGTV